MASLKPENKCISWVIFAFAAAMALGLVLSISPSRISGDFDVYYNAGKNYLAGEAVYLPHGGIEEFKYSPLFALLFSPLSRIEKIPALYIWNILNIFLLYGIFYLFYRLRQISFSRWRDFLLILAVFALTGRYIFSNIKIGQANILLCFLLVWMMYWEVNKKYFRAAVCLTFALMIKFFPLIFLAYFLLRRQFKIAIYTFSLIAIFLLLPGIYSGFSNNLNYLREWLFLLNNTPAHMFYSVKNYSLLAFFSWFFIARHQGYSVFEYGRIASPLTAGIYTAWLASCLVLFCLFFYDSFLKKEREQRLAYLDYSCLFVCGILFNPFAYLNALVFLLVPYFFILRSLFYRELSKPWAKISGALVIASFIFLMTYNKVFFMGTEAFNEFLKYRFPTLVMILVYSNLWLVKFAFTPGKRFFWQKA